MHVHAQHTSAAVPNKLTFLSPGPDGTFTEVKAKTIPLKSAAGIIWNSIPVNGGEDGHIASPYMNSSQNSLSRNIIIGDSLKIKWQVALNPDYEPKHIIAVKDRIIVEAAFWQLYNLEGKILKQDKVGMSHVVMDDMAKCFYYVSSGGELVVRNFENGSLRLATLLKDGDEYMRPLILFHNNIFTVPGIERQLDPHGHRKASRSSLTTLDVRNLLKKDNDPNNDFAEELGTLYIPSPKSVVAAFGNNISFAYPGNILLVNTDLNVSAKLTGNFTPLSISRDAAGNMVLLNDNEQGRCIWLITENGEIVFSSPVKDAIIYPPITGSNHRLFIPCKKGICVIESDGEQKMGYIIKNSFKGATAIVDNKLLVCDGNLLVLFDNEGASRVLFDSGSEDILTSPVILKDGSILIATRRNLYCLTNK